MVDSWQEIIWREWYFCYDDDYASRLQRLIGNWPNNSSIEDRLEETNRPTTMAVEMATRQAVKIRHSDYDWDERLQELDQIREQGLSQEALLNQLQARHWLDRIIACHMLVPFGGDVIDALKIHLYGDSPLLQSLSQWVVQSISAETTRRLSKDADQLLCTTCLVHCYPLEIPIPGEEPIIYYGCRKCGQSREFQTWPGGVVAVLDAAMTEDRVEKNNVVRVNWLQRRNLFDFDWVEIIRANDEHAERFAVQAGNDTDPVRKPRYKTMYCIIQPECKLSRNTLKILESMFGEVQHAPIP